MALVQVKNDTQDSDRLELNYPYLYVGQIKLDSVYRKRSENITYYIGDLHFGHANAISFDHRLFENVEEMNKALVQNWNARVTSDDTVYVLGDMFFKYKQSNATIMAKLNGRKHLIKGTHYWGKVLEKPWESVQPYLEIGDENRRVILCHFPIPFYNRGTPGCHHALWSRP